MIREINKKDIDDVLKLYLSLHEKSIPLATPKRESIWNTILEDKNYHIIVCEVNGIIVSSCTCIVILNLTRNLRPYALIENVVTHEQYRGNGYASACLAYAKNIAEHNGCYKMMLLTSAKDDNTLAFYNKAGFNSNDKTAFVKYLNIKKDPSSDLLLFTW